MIIDHQDKCGLVVSSFIFDMKDISDPMIYFAYLINPYLNILIFYPIKQAV